MQNTTTGISSTTKIVISSRYCNSRSGGGSRVVLVLVLVLALSVLVIILPMGDVSLIL